MNVILIKTKHIPFLKFYLKRMKKIKREKLKGGNSVYETVRETSRSQNENISLLFYVNKISVCFKVLSHCKGLHSPGSEGDSE